jgi:sterol desaturase/sphingolipid hydroxylase (fatty acid hydroxylase superfamily)
LRTILFCIAFVGLTLFEGGRARVPARSAGDRRWWSNIGLHFSNVLIVTALSMAAAAAGIAAMPEDLSTSVLWFAGAFLLLDLTTYALHRAYHAIPWMWRVHAVHHSDVDLDASTAVRHHPVEYVTTTAAMVALAWTLGIDAVVVAAYGTAAVLVQLLQHANVRLPASLESALAPFVMVPAAHRHHHDIDTRLANRNFGTIFTFWDRVFGTYVPPYAEEGERRYGIEPAHDAALERYDVLLALPFRFGLRTASRN